ncbi:sensor histidine kinase [Miniphocaeibacter massiliensis]|uniref:sensor histidine kinase n=1 Tax=Miniphocaeibacter massiliensis TaxID=2041841 RepID=UPI0013EB6DC5|nr:HAMP domain-containing sensor histidine kinase [Miniphocaeibacter massiliensis]
MSKGKSLKKLFIGFLIVIISLNIFYIINVVNQLEKRCLIYSSIILSISILLSCLILVFKLNKLNSEFVNRISETIDKMTNNESNISFNSDEETLFSRVEYRLNRLYNMLKANNNSVNEDREKLQELISDISHQVKTPVTNLKMAKSFLKAENINIKEKNEAIETINAQVKKIDFLMKALVKTSRLEAGVIKLNIQPNNLYETIARSVGGVYLKAKEKSLNIEINCKEDFIIPHDSKWTGEAIFNILENAVKYTKENGFIKISVEKWEKYTKIDISDNGIGIPEQSQGRIFQRFYREEKLHDVEGIGVGLYLSREIISKEGGYIKVKSKEGMGSTFSIFLLN